MKYFITYTITVTCLLFVSFGFSKSISANEIGFSVAAKLSEKQKDKSNTYFDLEVTPGAEESLDIELKNNTDEEITVLAQANTATTNNNGVIDYSLVDPDYDKSLVFPFSEMTELDPEIKLAPQETKIVTAKVNIPEESFEGIILGGFHFRQKESASEGDQAVGVQIENKFAYVIGVRLSENDDAVKPDLKLLNVSADQRNYRNVIQATLQNPMPRILGDIELSADVYTMGNLDKPVYHSAQDKLNMAPNSNFSYGIKMHNKPFKAGKYLLKMTAKADGETWEFEKEFEIKSEEAKELNAQAVELAEEDSNYLMYIIITLLSLVIVIGIVVVIWSHYKKTHVGQQKKLVTNNKKSKRKKRKG